MSSSPSTLFLASSCAAVAAFALGYTVGSRGPLNASLLRAGPDKTPLVPDSSEAHVDDEKHSESDDSEEEDESLADGDLSVIQAGFMEPCKMVLVVRVDLNMTPGKVAAQCGHATLACYKALVKKNPRLIKHWERTGQAKIALKAKSEDQLLELEAIAKSLNLCARSIQDAGHTQVDPGTRTVLAIGPAPVELINQVTGKLRLF